MSKFDKKIPKVSQIATEKLLCTMLYSGSSVKLNRLKRKKMKIYFNDGKIKEEINQVCLPQKSAVLKTIL